MIIDELTVSVSLYALFACAVVFTLSKESLATKWRNRCYRGFHCKDQFKR